MKKRTTKEEKFHHIYELYVKDVYKASFYLTRNEDKAKEITQQTFLRLFENLERIEQGCLLVYLVQTVRDIIND